MTDSMSSPRRRALLALFASLPLVGRPGELRASDGTTLLVGGPDGSPLDRWSKVIQPTLSQALPPSTALRRQSVGGADGVTAANQFDARTSPDGQTALLVPGEAALAWLVGDPRARFDVARWVSVMVGITPALVVARPGAIAPGKRVRIATAGPGSGDLPALLGIELLGGRTELLPAIAPEAVAAAFGRSAVDAVLLRGYRVPDHMADLASAGARPAFVLGALDDSGYLGRCAAFPEVPTFTETLRTRNTGVAASLFAAWQAAAIAAQTDFALVVAQLTPADVIAMWRHAASEAVAALDVQAMATQLGVHAVGGPAATATAGATAASQAAVTDLRRWLTDRYKWKPA